MRTIFMGIVLAAVSALAQGSTVTCSGGELLYTESLAESGIHPPIKSAAVFYQDKLLERWTGEPGEQPEPKSIKVKFSDEKPLVDQKVRNSEIKVYSALLTVVGTDQEAHEANVVCTSVESLIPVP